MDVWSTVDLQRGRIADLLDTLTPAEWRQPSLCAGWTVRDVAGHLAQQPLTFGAGLRGLLRHPGSVNHMIHATARDRAAEPTDRLVAGIRATVGDHRPNPGLTDREALIDIVVHGADMAVPLARDLPVPPGAAAIAASRMWSYGESRRDRRKLRVFRTVPFRRYRFTATDTDWSVGEGPEIRGPIVSILLVITGRPAGLEHLTGAGTDTLVRHLQPA
ncbi:maleylpyruvate isomerase family mycothiol-dependent enzyme [Virgisporangium ochraceum]